SPCSDQPEPFPWGGDAADDHARLEPIKSRIADEAIAGTTRSRLIQESRSMRGVLLTIVGVLIVVVGLTAANLRRDDVGIDLNWQLLRKPPREVTLETPSHGQIVETITAPGEVELIEEAEIASQII